MGGWGSGEVAGVVGGVTGATRSGVCALPAIDTGERVANRQGWPVFEDRSRFAGSSGGSSPMVCGLPADMAKAAGVGFAGGLWCAGVYFVGVMRWGIMRLSSWPCSVVVV